MMRVKSFKFNDLIIHDIPVYGNGVFLKNPVMGVVFLPGDEKNTAFSPSLEEFIIDIPPVNYHNRTRRENQCPGNLYLVGLPFGNMGKYREVAVIIQKQMQFHSSLRLTKPGLSQKGWHIVQSLWHPD